MDIEEEPTPLTDPHAYLALFKFNRRLPKCLRTGVAVSYADIGAPDGIPVLFVPPSGCSRWFAAPQEQIASVLEHLDVKPAHMLATSAGVYIALRLLSSYPDLFLTGLTPPPSVYLVSPWSPPLPATDPLSYRQLLDWIPSGVLTTQDTTIPFVFNAVRGAEEAYGATTKAVGGAVTAVKSWLGAWTSAPASPEPSTRSLQDEREDGTETELDEKAEEEAPPRRLWAPTAKYLTTEYLYAEDFRGIGQGEDRRDALTPEHLLCLNRGEIDTGPAWFTTEIDAVAAAVRREQQNEEEDSCPKNRAEKEAEDKSGNDDSLQAGTEKDSSERDESEQDAELEQHPETDKLLRLPIDVWWGGLDGMVPRNGQEWLNKSFAAYPREIAFVTHFVEDGDHSDLIMRGQGVGEVYLSIMMQGHSTARE
ncbi:hypothetical protein CcaverHIS641_0104790 [Cutaneotrichosporon cavernicola]|nr:hypothetical protein CcaverHIS641_0104790 [Cutaneotrichosporon cavernicola]